MQLFRLSVSHLSCAFRLLAFTETKRLRWIDLDKPDVERLGAYLIRTFCGVQVRRGKLGIALCLASSDMSSAVQLTDVAVTYSHQLQYIKQASPSPSSFTMDDPNKLNSYTALEIKTLVAIEDNGVPLKNVKYLELYKDDTKAHLYDDDDVMDFTGSLGGRKNHPMFFLYDKATAENGDGDDDENENKSGDESSSSSSSSDSGDDDGGTGGYMAVNRGDLLYTDLIVNPNTYGDSPFYNVEKRNKRGKVIDTGAVRIGDVSRVPAGLRF
ncbi:hypothetical protein BDZ97DRAFT_298857 [Flammula alnicola]|nr:hypothetical protein BDZ97DRAFT_298857 [Flammula alnicola]